MSQLDLSIEAGISARHLSFVETGPANPSHELSDPELAPVRAAVQQILDGLSPYPAVLIDQHWHLIEANPAVALFTAGAGPHLLTPPINVLRLSLHPDGMAPRILNLPEWRSHLLHRLRQEAVTTNDPALYELHEELGGYPNGNDHAAPISDAASRVAIPLRYRHNDQELSFFSTTTLFGTPLGATVAGLAIEAFFPADPTTTETLYALAKA